MAAHPTLPATGMGPPDRRLGSEPGSRLRSCGVGAGPSYLFHQDGDFLVPTELVRGPWDHRLQHGGAVCGALAWAILDAIDTDDPGCAPPSFAAPPADGDQPRFQLCRLTVEILRPVPVAPLAHQAVVVHRGSRSRVVEAQLLHQDRVMARATSQWALSRPVVVAGAEGGPTGTEKLTVDPAVPRRPPGATNPGAVDVGYPRPGFNCDVFELRCLVGSTEDEGPGTIWTRMLVDVMADDGPHPILTMATLGDLANAVGWERSPNRAPMINPDVTVQLTRYPRDRWICLEAQATATGAGIGMMETTLWDGDGRFGRVLSTTVESPVSLAVDL